MGGLWRRVPERVRVLHERARKLARLTLDDAPAVWDVVEAAYRAYKVDRGELERWRAEKALAWVLPEVKARYTFDQSRDTDSVLAPEFERPIITQVNIEPHDHEFRVTMNWDLYPVFWAMLDTDNSYGTRLADEGVRRIRVRDELRSRVTAAYNTWLRKRVSAMIEAPADARDAIHRQIEIERLEAELHGLTGGWFVPSRLPAEPRDDAGRSPGAPPTHPLRGGTP